MRMCLNYDIKNPEEFREKLLNWCNQFSTFTFLNSNKGSTSDHLFAKYDFIAACGIYEVLKPEKGKAFLEKAVKLNPGFGAAHFYLGECFRDLDRRDQAMASYKQAVKRNPRDAGSLSALGLLYDEKGENPEISMMFCENSVAISPDKDLYLIRLGDLYEKHGHLQKALDMFERAALLGYDAADKIEALKVRLAKLDTDLEHGDDAYPVSRVASKS